MRRAYQPRHLLAVLIFIAVSAAMAYQASLDDRLSESQLNLATAALKHSQPNLFVPDAVFGERDLWRIHSPAFLALMELSLVPTGYHDALLPFRLLTGAALLVYLCGMYALCYHQCRSWSISAFVAVLSSAVVHTLGGAYWGLGSLDSITPAAVVQSMVPLIVLSYLRYQNQWRVMLVFGFVGLCGNLHLPAAINLALILLVVYLACRRFRPSAWPRALACGLAAAMGALPYAGYYMGLKLHLAAEATDISAAATIEALRLANPDVLYPELIQSAIGWLPWLAVLAIPSLAVLARIERFRVRNLGVWLSALLAGLAVAFGLQWLSQWATRLGYQAQPIIDFAQAGSLVMLPLYVLFAQGLTNLFRLVRRHRHALRWCCAVLLAAWVLPSDNVRFARHRFYQLLALPIAEQYRPRNVQRHAQRRAERAELVAMAEWAGENTPAAAVFLCEQSEFRLRARRAIVASSDDVLYFYRLTPWRLAQWLQTLQQLRQVSRPAGRVDPAAVKQFVNDLARRPEFAKADGWYLICRAGSEPAEIGILEPVAADRWPKHWLLYRIR